MTEILFPSGSKCEIYSYGYTFGCTDDAGITKSVNQNWFYDQELQTWVSDGVVEKLYFAGDGLTLNSSYIAGTFGVDPNAVLKIAGISSSGDLITSGGIYINNGGGSFRLSNHRIVNGIVEGGAIYGGVLDMGDDTQSPAIQIKSGNIVLIGGGDPSDQPSLSDDYKTRIEVNPNDGNIVFYGNNNQALALWGDNQSRIPVDFGNPGSLANSVVIPRAVHGFSGSEYFMPESRGNPGQVLGMGDGNTSEFIDIVRSVNGKTGDVTLLAGTNISIIDNTPAGITIDMTGGLQTVNSISARDNIPTDNRKEGMLVYVISTQNYYQLIGGITNTDWVLFTGGGTGSFVGIILKSAEEIVSGIEALEFREGKNVTIGITGSGITGYIDISVTTILGGTFN